MMGKNNKNVSDKAMKKNGSGRAELEGRRGSGGEGKGPWDVKAISKI